MSLIHLHDRRGLVQESFQRLGEKCAADGQARLSGMLQLNQDGYLVLTVPNALVRGLFQSLDAPGVELPPAPEGRQFQAQLVVMTPEEVAAAGGPEAITERGRSFSYRIVGLEDAPARNWPEISRCWMLRVTSLPLQALRKSYGLTALPGGGQEPFSILVACRRSGVLGHNTTSKSRVQPAEARFPEWAGPTA